MSDLIGQRTAVSRLLDAIPQVVGAIGQIEQQKTNQRQQERQFNARQDQIKAKNELDLLSIATENMESGEALTAFLDSFNAETEQGIKAVSVFEQIAGSKTKQQAETKATGALADQSTIAQLADLLNTSASPRDKAIFKAELEERARGLTIRGQERTEQTAIAKIAGAQESKRILVEEVGPKISKARSAVFSSQVANDNFAGAIKTFEKEITETAGKGLTNNEFTNAVGELRKSLEGAVERGSLKGDEMRAASDRLGKLEELLFQRIESQALGAVTAGTQAQFTEGQTAVNPDGVRVVFTNGKWVPIK